MIKFLKHYILVFALLVVPKRVHEHGVGRSCVRDHVALIKIAQTSLEHVAVRFWCSVCESAPGLMNLFWHVSISLSNSSKFVFDAP